VEGELILPCAQYCSIAGNKLKLLGARCSTTAFVLRSPATRVSPRILLPRPYSPDMGGTFLLEFRLVQRAIAIAVTSR
jgi:hypothetical protein